MKLVILLVGLALVAWLVATQLNGQKTVVLNGVDQGTPKQILDHTRESVTHSMQVEQQQANDRAAAAGANQ
jgi:hypothetical protein